MRFRTHGAVLAAVALLCAQPSRAADNYVVRDANGTMVTMGSKFISAVQYPIHILYGMFGGAPMAVTTDASGNLNVNVVSGGGGSSAVKATAAAPTLTEGSTTNQPSSDLQGNQRVKDQALITALGSPFQAGASIGNSSFGISGTLPAFAATPTFNCGTGCSSTSAASFIATGQAILATTAATARIALPTADTSVILTNNGAADLYFRFGNSSVNAATTDFFLGAGRSLVLSSNSNTYIASVTSSGSTTMLVTTGTGVPVISGGGGVGGGTAPALPAYTLLNNASSSGLNVTVNGGSYMFALSGAFGGTTVALTGTVGGVTTTYGSYTTAQPGLCISVGQGTVVQATVTGGSPSALFAYLNGSNCTNSASAATVATSGAGAVSIAQADTSVPISVSTATTTQLVALSAGKKIYVTALDILSGGTGNVTFVYGTGSACGTGTTALTGAYPLTAQNGLAKGGGLGPVLIVPASNALCITTSAAVTTAGSVAYAQF